MIVLYVIDSKVLLTKIKDIMKFQIKNLLLVLGATMLFYSCSKDEDYVDPVHNEILKTEANVIADADFLEIPSYQVILYPYLSLDNNQYSLDISKDEALKKGVTESEYDIVMTELNNTNEVISSVEVDEDNSLELFDPKSISINKLLEQQKTDKISKTSRKTLQQNPSGYIDTNGQEEGYDSFFAPYGKTYVRFECLSNAALTPAFVCRTKGLSGQWKSVTKVGVLGKATVDVNIDASNINIGLSFRTSDSNGGKAAWTCY